MFSCGQLLIRIITSANAFISTYLPGADTPSSNLYPPSFCDRHIHKEVDIRCKVTLLMSAVVSASCNIKLSRQLCIYLFSLAYLTVLLCDEQAPPKVSCLPVLSAVISSNGLPDSALKILPLSNKYFSVPRLSVPHRSDPRDFPNHKCRINGLLPSISSILNV